MVKKIAIATGGGDCGGLNAAIEAVMKAAANEGLEVEGYKKGWEGFIFDDRRKLRISDVEGIHSITGTLIQTSRTNPYNYTGELNGQFLQNANISGYVMENLKRASIDGVIICGGDDTLSVIPRLIKDYGDSIPFIGIPKTMDGDLQTYSLGLDTAINRAKQVLEDFVPTLKANGSIGFVEIFGRDVGRVTFKAGVSGGADVILLPEIPVDLEYTIDFIAKRYHERGINNGGTSYVLIAVAEGTEDTHTRKKIYQDKSKDSFGHGKLGGIGEVLAKLVHEKLKNDSRIRAHTRKLDVKTQQPTYNIRDGATLYSDSYIGQKLGAAAVQYLLNSAKSGMAVVNFDEIGRIQLMPIEKLIEPRLVHIEVLKLFERSGLYCFGRKPEEISYKPLTDLN